MARRQQQRATSLSLSAPIGGWNARDSIAAMPELDAVTLVNFFPATSDVVLRFGMSQYATGFPGLVETILSYSGSTTDKLFGISQGSVYDATAGGAVGAASLSGLSNSRWQYVNFTTSGGNYIVMANGVDSVKNFDGTTWTSPAITGVTSSNLITVNVHMNRLWFCEVGTLKAWYLPTASIAGAAASLDLSAFAPHGGYLMAMGTWTIDAGYGMDDLAVFITSKGDIIVYRGTDPSSATTWSLVGVFYMGSPVGRRCFVKYKGDILLITQDGLVPLSSYLQSSRLDPRVTLTDKIQYTTSQAISVYGSNFGWQVIPFQKQNMLFLNVPYGVETNQQQFVMNTITGNWCNFQGWYASVWEMYQDNLYYGTNTSINKAWDTFADNGADINADGLQAFNYFSSPGQLKRFTMIRPVFLTNGTPAVLGNMNIDFDTTKPTASLVVTPTSYGFWDSAVWDTGLWGVDLSVSRFWQGATGVGYAAAPRVIAQTNGLSFHWVSTDIVLEPGAIL